MAVNATEVLYLTSGLFKAVPSKAILTDLVKFNGNIDQLAATLGTSEFAINAFPFSNAEKAKLLAENLLGSTVADKAAAITALEGILNANGGNVGIAAAAGIRAILTDAAFADAKAQLENRVKVAEAYVDSNKGNEISTSVLDAVTNDAATVTTAINSLTGNTGGNEAGVSRVLTTGQDVFTGTAGDDNFRAVAGVQQGSQDQTTLNSSDNIDGATGDDTLIVNMTGTNYAGGARIKNIETLQIGTNLNAAVTFDYNVNMGDNEVSGVNTVKYDQITTGETLNVINITPSATGTTIPTLHWANENGSTAGTAGATYRQASIAGTADNQNVILENVTNGVLNIARGIETITVTSSGTVAANTLANGANLDGTAVDLVSENQGGNNVADDSTLTKVIAKGEKALGVAATVNTNDVAGETGYGLTNRAADGLSDLGNSTHAGSASNLLSVAATVTEIDATEANGGINARFTGRVDGAAVNVTFKGGKAADYIEFARGNVNATGGEGADTFAFLNSNLTNFDFGSADSITGGAGSDTIQLGVNGNGTVVANTTEFNNKTGIDVLDLRGAVNTVTLADAFVAGADAGTFTVRTDKIVQTSGSSTANTTPSNATNNAGLENASVNTVVLTELADNRAIEFIGGSGSDRVVVDNASANQFTKLDGGTNAAAGSNDSLTVVNTAVLDANDVANIKGFELLNLVENVNGNSSFNVTISEAFLLANSTTAVNLTLASVTNTYGQRLGAGDTVNLEISDLLSAGVAKASIANRVVNVQDLIAAGVTVNFQQNGVTVSTNAAPAALAANVNLNTAPAATLLDDVTGVTAAVAPAVVNLTAGGAFAGTANVNDNFTGTLAALNGTTVTGTAADTETLTLTTAGTVNINDAGTGGNVTNIDNLVLADGANTVTFTAGSGIRSITGGAGVDTVTNTNMTAGGTVNLGGGNDIFNLTTAADAAATSINGGDGTDTLNVAAINISGVGTISGFEIVNFAGNTTMTVAQSAQLAALAITSANAAHTLTFSNAGTATEVGTFNTYVLAAAGNNFTLTGAGTVTSAGGATAGHSITGSAGNDTITGGAQNDTINGGDGDDQVTMSAGNDTVNLGAGNDAFLVAAVTGNVTVTGGAGNDTYTLTTAAVTAGQTGVVTITDFKVSGADQLRFDLGAGAAVAAAADIANVVADQVAIIQTAKTSSQITTEVTAGAQANSVIVVFNSSTGRGEVWFDTDWNDVGNREQLATLDNITTVGGVTGLIAGDFAIV